MRLFLRYLPNGTNYTLLRQFIRLGVKRRILRYIVEPATIKVQGDTNFLAEAPFFDYLYLQTTNDPSGYPAILFSKF